MEAVRKYNLLSDTNKFENIVEIVESLTGAVPNDENMTLDDYRNERISKLYEAPSSINADLMTEDEIHAKLKKGYDDAVNGRITNAAEAFRRFRKSI